jgi:hypothetical protein
MPRAFRSRAFAVTILTAFVLAQPAAWCSALCLLERHSAAEHPAAGAPDAMAAHRGADCHTTDTGAVQHGPLQTLSPMEPVTVALAAATPSRWAEPARAPVISPLDRSHTAEPPPPRLA